jgi:hypothetical protein
MHDALEGTRRSLGLSLKVKLPPAEEPEPTALARTNDFYGGKDIGPQGGGSQVCVTMHGASCSSGM